MLTVFTDLDDSLITSAGKLTHWRGDASCVGLSRDGAPHAYLPEAARVLIDTLRRGGATLIPVTGQSEEALNRLHWHGQWPFSPISVTDQGLRILRGERQTLHEDTEWATHVQRHLSGAQQALKDVLVLTEALVRAAGSHWSTDTIGSYSAFHTARFSGPDAATQAAQLAGDLKASAQRCGLQVICNSRYVTIRPPGLGKKDACAHLSAQIGGPTLAIGDSFSDLGMLLNSDYVLAPSTAQLLRDLHNHPEAT